MLHVVWIQSLRQRLSTLCRFIAAWAFETQGQALLTVESINAFVIIPPSPPA
ncbi:putative phosphatase [Edwardsiella piscicida]|nr:putative phosphatase [Edwardsiella piscicida]